MIEPASSEPSAPSADAGPPRLGPVATVLRWAELFVLFVAVPGFFAAWIDPYNVVRPHAERFGLGGLYELPIRPNRLLLPTLMVFTLVIAAVLILDRRFPSRRLWNFRAAVREMPRVLGLFAIGAPLMLALAWAADTYTPLLGVRFADGEATSAFLYLPRERPGLLLLIAVGYPIISAYPQEITHRAFFFHRYAPILRTPRAMIVVNAAVFAWMHAPFWSWVALVMTFVGGLLFARTYHRSRSALAAGVEHGLWGWWAFVVGFGYFVFAGGIAPR